MGLNDHSIWIRFGLNIERVVSPAVPKLIWGGWAVRLCVGIWVWVCVCVCGGWERAVWYGTLPTSMGGNQMWGLAVLENRNEIARHKAIGFNLYLRRRYSNYRCTLYEPVRIYPYKGNEISSWRDTPIELNYSTKLPQWLQQIMIDAGYGTKSKYTHQIARSSRMSVVCKRSILLETASNGPIGRWIM